MTFAVPYQRKASFPDDRRLELEFNALKVTTDQINDNLKAIQRDDDRLDNESVYPETLHPTTNVWLREQFVEFIEDIDLEAGPQGLKGDKGDKGDRGDDGTDGVNGLSAYEVWLAAGNTGAVADYLDATKGAKGDPGADGVGFKGDKGDQGDQGLPGVNGDIVHSFETVSKNLEEVDFTLERDPSTGLLSRILFANGVKKIYTRDAGGKLQKVTLQDGQLPTNGIRLVKNLLRDAGGKLSGVTYTFN
jgi:hypothetical protein